jgi:hypothetical protein
MQRADDGRWYIEIAVPQGGNLMVLVADTWRGRQDNGWPAFTGRNIWANSTRLKDGVTETYFSFTPPDTITP